MKLIRNAVLAVFVLSLGYAAKPVSPVAMKPIAHPSPDSVPYPMCPVSSPNGCGIYS